MFKQRLITAIIIAALFLSGVIFLPPLYAEIFLGAIWLVGAWEWSAFARLKGAISRLSYVVIVALAMFGGYHLVEVLELINRGQFFAAAAAAWAVFALWIQGYPSSAVLWRSKLVSCLVGLVVIVPAWMAMTLLQSDRGYGIALIWVLALVVANDTGAYLVGKTFGKHKLAVKVSPKKTWEGFFGGLVAAFFVALGMGFSLGSELFGGWVAWLLAAILSTLAAVIGDLLESMFKRETKIKDSGTILPGHGGIMDRLDSLSAAFPVFALIYFS